MNEIDERKDALNESIVNTLQDAVDEVRNAWELYDEYMEDNGTSVTMPVALEEILTVIERAYVDFSLSPVTEN